MAKDIFGREITPGTPAGAYNSMARQSVSDLSKFVSARAANPAKTLGQDARAIVNGVGQGMQAYGNAVNQAPKLFGIPAAAVANTAAKGVANFQTGFTGDTYKPKEFEALNFGQMWDRTWKPGGAMAATPAAPTPAVTPTTTPSRTQRPETTYTPGAGLPSASQVASDKARAGAAQMANDARIGVQPADSPVAISVNRQPNGVLSFTGSGGGSGVQYQGLPNWTSQRGGAGQGAVGGGFNLGEQNQRMAVALQGIQAMDQQKKAASMIDAMSSGAGGAVGVAQNKAAMGALGPLLERQMANQTALETANIVAQTQRRGQDIGATADAARTKASIYGTDVGAKTAATENETRKQQVAATLTAAGVKSLDPSKVSKAALSELQLSLILGKTRDGKIIDPAIREDLTKRFMALGGNSNYMMYGGMPTNEE